MVVVGEMEVGWGETRDAGPSFGMTDGGTKGKLGCGYHLKLEVRTKEGKSKWPIVVDQVLPVGISSTFAVVAPQAEGKGEGKWEGDREGERGPAVPPKDGERPPTLPTRRVGGGGVSGTTDDLPPSYLQVEDGWADGLMPEPKGDLKG